MLEEKVIGLWLYPELALAVFILFEMSYTLQTNIYMEVSFSDDN